MTWLKYDEARADEIASRMDLRAPNKGALKKSVQSITDGDGREIVCDLATGVGKTYLAAALVEYLASQGVRNVLIVTPGSTIQGKTIDNFTPEHPKFVPGMDYSPVLITPENFSRGQIGDALHNKQALKLFVFNVQQLIRPTANLSRRVRRTDEFIGNDLYSHLQAADDLVIIADEHHVYREKAASFSTAIRELNPRALIGLTATPDKADLDKVVYRYTLAEAIADMYVKIPVIVYREDGHKDIATQLADACHLRDVKDTAYRTWANGVGKEAINPVLFVVCQNVQEAEEAANLLAAEQYIGDPSAVLLITNQSSDEALAALQDVERPDSPIRAVVSVDKLKEGWDVKNIGVIVALRRLASDALTEQILGRGLRLPFGKRVGVPMIDQVDLVAHDSYRRLLEQKDALIERIAPTGESAETGEPLEPAEEQRAEEESVASITEKERQGTLQLSSPPRVIDGEQVDGSTLLLLQHIAETEKQGRVDATFQVLRRVAGAPQITFPKREQEILPVRFSLSLVDDVDARTAGAGFAREIKIPLIREALVVERDMAGEIQKVRREAQEADVAVQKWIPLDQVTSDLESKVLGLGLVEESLAEYNATKRVVRAFLEGAGATEGSEISWGAERAHQAVHGIGALIQQKYNARRLQPTYRFRTITLPEEPKPMPTDVLDRYEDDFERGRYYKGWVHSILPIASFDAQTTEWTLANLLDNNGSRISWWLRLQSGDPACIELDGGGKYYPDFIAIDADGTQWLIEGKAERDVSRADVQEKRRAAEEWARFVNDDGRFGTWRYLFCAESTVKRAHGSWDSLLVAAGAM